MLSSVDWHIAFSNCSTAQRLWDVFRNNRTGNRLFCLIFKDSKHVSKPKLYSKYVPKLYAKKKARWSLYRTFRTPELKVKYKSEAKRCSQAIMDLTAKKENHLCDNANLGAFPM